MSEIRNRVLHDLLNQASIVKGFAELLQKGEEGERRQRMLMAIKRNAEKLAEGIESLNRDQRDNPGG